MKEQFVYYGFMSKFLMQVMSGMIKNELEPFKRLLEDNVKTINCLRAESEISRDRVKDLKEQIESGKKIEGAADLDKQIEEHVKNISVLMTSIAKQIEENRYLCALIQRNMHEELSRLNFFLNITLSILIALTLSILILYLFRGM